MPRSRLLYLTTMLAAAAVLLAACDRRAWYEGMQAGQRTQCMRLPPAEGHDCEARIPGSYEGYERERQGDR